MLAFAISNGFFSHKSAPMCWAHKKEFHIRELYHEGLYLSLLVRIVLNATKAERISKKAEYQGVIYICIGPSFICLKTRYRFKTMSPLYPCVKPCSTGNHNETMKQLTLESLFLTSALNLESRPKVISSSVKSKFSSYFHSP